MEFLVKAQLSKWTHITWNNKWYIGSAVVGTVLAWKILTRKRYNLPPGPSGWDVFTSEDMEEDIKKLKDQYGDIIYVHSYLNPMVILASHKAIKEAFITQAKDFSHRPIQRVLRLMNFYDEVFAAGVSTEWTRDRKFASSALRQFVAPNAGIDELVLEEVEALVGAFKSTQGDSINFDEYIQRATANIIHKIVFGERFNYGDQRLNKFTKLSTEWLACFSEHAQDSTVLPDILWRILNAKPAERIWNANLYLKQYVAERIKEHKESFNSSNMRDFVDVYLQARLGEKNVDWDRTCETILVFLLDSVDSISPWISWIVLYLGINLEWQTQLQAEIDQISKDRRFVTLTDRQNCSKTEAFCMEVMRIIVVVSQSGPHTCAENTKLRGYVIPKGVTVIGSLYSAMHDEDIFPHPNTFDPGRFLDSKTRLTNTEKWIPFSIGKRMCLGEQLTRTEVFLFVSNLLKNFHITFPDDEAPPSLKAITHISRTPNPYSVAFMPRSTDIDVSE